MKYILGTANFGNKYKGIELSATQSEEILEKAWELGIRDIDTARSYENSESIIGKYISGTKHNFRVWTKGRSVDDYEKSKDALGMLPWRFIWHNWDKTDDITCHVDGISCYSPEGWEEVHERNGISVIQTPWNILDRSSEEFVRQADQYGIDCVARSVFLRGEAFKFPDIAGVPFWKWCLQIPNIFEWVCIGVDTPEQLEHIINVPRLRMMYSEDGLKCRMER